MSVNDRVVLAQRCVIVLAAVAVACLVSGKARAQDASTDELLTLDRAVQMALSHQPSLEVQRGQLLAAEARTGQALGNYYPRLSAGGAYTRIWPVSSQTGSSTSQAGLPPGTSYIPTSLTSSGQTYEQYAVTGNLNQVLYDFGKTHAQVGAQKAGAQAAKLQLENTKEQVVFAVKQAYYALLGNERAREVALEAIEQFGRHVEYARELFEAGAKPKFEVTKAEVDLGNAKVNLIKAENGIRLARANLNNAIGIPNTSPYRVQDDGPSPVEVPFDEAMETALKQRPDLLSLQQQKKSARETIKAAMRAYFPTFSGVASGVWVATGFPLDHGYTAGVNMSVPLFDGFVTHYQVTEAQANLAVAEGNERGLRQTIALDVEQGFIALREAAEQTQSTEIVVRQGKENVELANERYAAGLAIGVEVSDAIAAYADARLSNIAAYYDYKIAIARIEKAMGGRAPVIVKPTVEEEASPRLTSLEK